MNLRYKHNNARASALRNSLNDALSLLSSGQPRKALSKAIEVLKQAPRNGMALNIAGVCSHSLGRLKDAEHYWCRALEENPVDAEVHNNLGILFMEAGRFTEAETAYREALAMAMASLPISQAAQMVLIVPARDGTTSRDGARGL